MADYPHSAICILYNLLYVYTKGECDMQVKSRALQTPLTQREVEKELGDKLCTWQT